MFSKGIYGGNFYDDGSYFGSYFGIFGDNYGNYILYIYFLGSVFLEIVEWLFFVFEVVWN